MGEIDSKELSEYLKALAEGIENGLEDTKLYVASGDKITVELAVVNSKGAGGGLKIFVVEAGSKYNKEEISKITIPLHYRYEFSATVI